MTRKDKKEPSSAALLCRLFYDLEREGSIRVGELASALHISDVTATRYVRALQDGNWMTLGRVCVGEAARDRKLRPSPSWHFCVLSVSRTHVRTLRFCPATEQCERQSVTLCDAIPTEDALSAALHRVLGSLKEHERTADALGVIVEDDVPMPPAAVLGLSPAQIQGRDELTEAGLVREYGVQSVLYIRYGDLLTLRLLAGGHPLSSLRSYPDWQMAWDRGAQARLTVFRQSVAHILSVLIPEAVVLESDGADAEALSVLMKKQLETDVAAWNSTPTLHVLEEMNMAEQEMLYRMHMHLAERILS